MATKLFYVEIEAEDCACAVTLNGAPILDERLQPPRSYSAAVPASEWVIAGDNSLAAKVSAVGDAPALRVRLREGLLGDTPSASTPAPPPLASLDLELPEGLPFVPVELEDTAPAHHGWGQWYWESSPMFATDRRARQDVFDYLVAIHATLSGSALDPFLDANRIKFSDLSVCYGDSLASIRAEFSAALGEIRGQPNWRLAPIEPDAIEFRVHCDHRVLEPVMRETGAPVIRDHDDMGGLGWGLPLLLGRLDAYRSDQLAIVR